ncbi:hypothetical protein F7725_010999 [Dissostichus mawsoni]|uniref:Mammalian ependymin-related protein 1 n=1 Tax=Dissostichus mawsoni TaxID=36200 RepID=A0A7J5ZBT9_DISMA|nr:hypothetical protein F7725_010999 [Dissostichus mawsoni]
MHRLLLVFVAASGASVLGLPVEDVSPPSDPCLAPLQWEGRWVSFDHSTGRNSRSSVSYDGLKQRVRVLQQNKKHTPCQRFFEYIFLYQSGVMFQIDQKTKDCSKIALTDAFDPFDIPKNSTFEDQYLIGGPGDSVEETYVRNSSVTTSTRFFNLQLGISDPNVFTPPSTCQSARPQRMSDSSC